MLRILDDGMEGFMAMIEPIQTTVAFRGRAFESFVPDFRVLTAVDASHFVLLSNAHRWKVPFNQHYKSNVR